MRRKELSMRLLSIMLAAGVAFTSTFSGAALTTVKAEEPVGISAVSENDVTESQKEQQSSVAEEKQEIRSEQDADEDMDDLTEEENLEADRTDGEEGLGDLEDGEEGPGLEEGELEEIPFEDAFAKASFRALYNTGNLTCDSTKITFDDQTVPDGVIVSGKNKNLASADFMIETEVDFGSQEASFVSVDMLAKRGTKTFVKLFVDDVAEPIAEMRLPIQLKDDDWSKMKECSFNIADYKLSGVHKFHFQLVDETTAEDKKSNVLLRSIQFTSFTIPVVNLNIDESYAPISDMHEDTNHATECYGDVTIEVPQGYTSEFDSEGTYQGGTYKLDYIRGRGNSTWMADKKPYKIKLDEAADLFGMGANKHWVLLANHYDNSLVRNRMTYQMGRDLGIAFTPDCVSVDVYMNNEYLGNYLLCEQIRIGESRVDIFDLEKEYEKKELTEESNLTGGYLLALEPYGNEMGYGFKTEKGVSFYVESPESVYDTQLYERMPIDYYYGDSSIPDEFEDTSRYALANSYISDYVQQVEDAIYGENFENEDGVSYRDLMDVDSAVAYYWMQMFSMNGDAYFTPSTYLHKDKDGKLCWGPLWDFDYVAWASYDYTDYEADTSSYSGTWCQFPWFKRLLQDPYFLEKVKAYWSEQLKPEVEKVIAEDGLLTQYQNELQVSAQRNFDRWGYTSFGFGDYYGEEQEGVEGQDFAFEINRLRSWIRHRTDWMDENLDSIEPRMVKVAFMNDGEEYMSFDTYMYEEYYDFPETPQPKNGEDVFAGWYYDELYTDEETGETMTDSVRFLPGEYVSDQMLSENDTVIIYAKWIDKEDVVPVDLVHFDRTEYRIMYDSQSPYTYGYQIIYGIAPFDATNMELTWESSDESVVSAGDYGFLTVMGSGEATVTATTAEGKSFSIKVRVMDENDIDEMGDYYVTDFELTESKVVMKENEVKGISINILPENGFFMGDEEDIAWITTDSQVVSVENGLLTANAPGEAVVLARVFCGGESIFRACHVVVEAADQEVEKEPTDQKNPEDVSKTESKEEEKKEPAKVEPSKMPEQAEEVKVGTKFTKGNLKYEVTSVTKTLEVRVTGMEKQKSSVSVPKTVKQGGKTYLVTSIKKNAFANSKKLTKVTIGANVKSIGSKAFYNCAKCKTVTIKSAKLKTVGKNAFAKISKKATVKVPKKNYTKYQKWFKSYKVKKA